MNYSDYRKRLLEWIRRQLIGPAVPGDLRGISPLRRYPVGVLYPTVAAGEGIDPASEEEYDEDYDEAAEAMEDDIDDSAQGVVRRRYVPPSSAGFSFYVSGKEWQIQVLFSAVVYRRKINEQGQYIGEYRRVELGGDEQALTLTSPQRRAVLPERSQDGIDRCLAGLDVRARSHKNGCIITVTLYNAQQMDTEIDARAWHDTQVERSLFEVRLACIVEQGSVGNYPRVEYSLLDEESQELELQYRDRKIYAVGHGCAVDWQLEAGRVKAIRSDFMPAVEVPQVTADVVDTNSRVLNIDFLSQAFEDSDNVCDELNEFVDAYGAWIAERRDELAELSEEEQKAAHRMIKRMSDVLRRMKGGVSLIASNKEVSRGFSIANQAMLEQMRQTNNIRGMSADPKQFHWRPFQLAFLLTTIKASMDDEDEHRDTVDLIWFPTGGGKTEAYLGLIAFVIAWRRLKYPQTGGGTTSLMRYTLRLLTTQQFQRATRIICALELIRQRNGRMLGDEPITVGLWVGSATCPNTFVKAQQQLEMALQGSSNALAGFVLSACPWCGTVFKAPDNFVSTASSFHFRCANGECDFGKQHDGRLPCNVVDEALYKSPPTLLIATIDKFARLAWEDRAESFFGVNGNRAPELIVQDELHLIAGALGSVAGVYESALNTVLIQRDCHPKYVASTATIRMAKDQVRRLYGKDVAVFPPQGLSADDAFFARTVPVEKRPGRLYIGYFAPMLNRQKNLAPLAAALLVAPERAFSDGERDREQLMEAWWSQVVYHGSLKGVGNSHNAFNIDVREHFDRFVEEARQEGYAISRGLPEVAQLTSISSAEENSRTFSRLEIRCGEPGCIDALLATNMVSVGLDVSRLALMVVNGQPLTTAEYIQASSRVGRSDVPGIVFINYYRDQARSLSHYENFWPYHESFYRFVEPTSVTPYTFQARLRALHAGLVIAVRHSVVYLKDNEHAAKFDPSEPAVARVIEDYIRRCCEADSERREEIRNHILALVEDWKSYADGCLANRRLLCYHARDNDRAVDRLIHNHDDRIQGLWPTLQSMRNVEHTGLLKAL